MFRQHRHDSVANGILAREHRALVLIYHDISHLGSRQPEPPDRLSSIARAVTAISQDGGGGRFIMP